MRKNMVKNLLKLLEKKQKRVVLKISKKAKIKLILNWYTKN